MAALMVAGLVVAATSLARSPRYATAIVGLVLAVEALLVVLSHRWADARARKSRLLGELASEANRAILLNEDESRIFSTILDYAIRIVENVNLGSVLAFDERGDLVIVASRGFSEEFVRSFRLRLEDTFQYRQSKGRITEAMIIEPEIVKGFADKLDSSKREYKSIISAPLFVGGELYGFLNMDSLKARSFDEDDLDLLKKFASQIEVCLLARKRYRVSLAASRVDALTGFLTRAHFEQLFEHSLEHARRFNEGFSLGMLDVDGLKTVNDRYGHPAGDRIIAAASAAIRRTTRKSDLLGRYGGDEFVAVCYATDARTMEERFSVALADLESTPVDLGGARVGVSFCFGFADYPDDGRDLGALIAAADARLYAMKARRPDEPSPPAAEA